MKEMDLIYTITFNANIHNEWLEVLHYNLPSVVELINNLDKIENSWGVGYANALKRDGIVKQEYESSHWGYEGGKRWVYKRDRGVVCPVTWKGDIANIKGFDYDPQKG